MPASADSTFTVQGAGGPLNVEVFTAQAPGPAVLVLHEVYGVNDDIRRIARRFADSGYTAAVPDLYRGAHWTRCSLGALYQLAARAGGSTADDLEIALQALAALPGVTRVGAVGFCMGGGFALCLGTKGTADVAGVFYGDTLTRERMAARMCPCLAVLVAETACLGRGPPPSGRPSTRWGLRTTS